MLVSSTILNGGYFGRSSKIISFLEEYNNDFENYHDVLSNILNSINIILHLDFNSNSYWFNKANLFTLLVEFSELDIKKIDFDVLEARLLELEKKVDLYFMAESEQDLKGITEEEKRYFEVARHGSHELAAREHRGEVIKNIIQEALLEDRVDNESVDFATIIPTYTGLNKGIIDATSSVRKFLMVNGIHNYDKQENGPDHKVKIPGIFVKKDGREEATEISMYKSNGRGDCRIWFTGLKEFADPQDEIILKVINGRLALENVS